MLSAAASIKSTCPAEEKIRAIAEHFEKARVTPYISGLKRRVRDVPERARILQYDPPKSKELALRTLLERYGQGLR